MKYSPPKILIAFLEQGKKESGKIVTISTLIRELLKLVLTNNFAFP